MSNWVQKEEKEPELNIGEVSRQDIGVTPKIYKNCHAFVSWMFVTLIGFV